MKNKEKASQRLSIIPALAILCGYGKRRNPAAVDAMSKKPTERTKPKWRWIVLAAAIVLSVLGAGADCYRLIVEYKYPITKALVIDGLVALILVGLYYWIVMGPYYLIMRFKSSKFKTKQGQ